MLARMRGQAQVGPPPRGQHTKPLIIRDMPQPLVLLLPRPPQELIPGPARQHRGPKPSHRDPLTTEHSDIPQDLTSQPVPEPVMLGQSSVETPDLIHKDRPDHHIPHTRPRHVYQHGCENASLGVSPHHPAMITRTLAQPCINTRVIIENWDQICRLTASLRAGTVTASAILRTLQRGPNSSSLARALAELGRIIKTLHVLQYCRDPEYRRTIRHLLNRGETRNSLARDVFHGHRASYASTTKSDRKTNWTPSAS